MEKPKFDVANYRKRFPALQKENPRIYLDAVGGTQVPYSVIESVTDYFINKNGNKGGVFPESRATDEVMERTREITADFLNAPQSKEILFGPHVGLLWGKQKHLDSLPAFKIRPAPNVLPDKWINGAQSYETPAGATAAMEYLASIGRDHPEYNERFSQFAGRRQNLKTAMTAIQDYENGLTWQFIDGMKNLPQYRIWGITDKKDADQRVPTIAVSRDGEQSNDMALSLSDKGINIWSRSVYSISLSERLGLEKTGGFIRVGFVHYNTSEEVNTLLNALDAYKNPKIFPGATIERRGI